MITMRRKFLLVQLHSESIGHFVRDTEIVLENIDEEDGQLEYKLRVLFYTQKKMVNIRFLEYLKSKYFVVPRFPAWLINKIWYRLSDRYKLDHDRILEKNLFKLNTIHKRTADFKFSSKELETGRNFLNTIQQGVKNQPIVCICIRDDGYDRVFKSPQRLFEQQYRNFDINDFSFLIEALVSAGYFVIRMGRHSSTELRAVMSGFYDYSNDLKNQSDFMDFYLFSQCSFVFSTGTGVDEIGAFFRKRIYLLHAAPPLHIPHSVLYPAKLLPDYILIDEKRRLSIDEILNSEIGMINPHALRRKLKVRAKNTLDLEAFCKSVINAEVDLRKNSETQSCESVQLAISSSLAKRFTVMDHFFY